MTRMPTSGRGAAMQTQGRESQSPLAIVSGGGSLPFAVADAVASRGRKVVIFAVNGITDAARVAGYVHHWIGIGQAGKLFRLMRGEDCHEMVVIGTVQRPPIWKVGFGFDTLRMLPAVISIFRG